MGFNHKNYTVAEIGVTGISGRTGVGISQLWFGVNFSVGYTRSPSVTVRDIRIRVDVAREDGGPTLFLGSAQTESAWLFSTKDFSYASPNQFILSLSDGQLFALEEFRGGHGLKFHLGFSALVDDGHESIPQQEPKTYEVNAAAWTKVLRELGGDEFLTLGVPLPRPEEGSPLKPSIALIRKAHKALLDGHYDTVVANCRLAIESARTVLDEGGAVQQAVKLFGGDRSARESMTKDQRGLVISEVARHYTHLAHHPGEGGAVELFSRDDALLLLSVCVSLVSTASKKVAS